MAIQGLPDLLVVFLKIALKSTGVIDSCRSSLLDCFCFLFNLFFTIFNCRNNVLHYNEHNFIVGDGGGATSNFSISFYLTVNALIEVCY